MSFTRREFVSAGMMGAGGAWLSFAIACRESADPATTSHAMPADAAAPPRTLRALTVEQFSELEAITSRIIPSGNGPGAKEAGVAWFIDDALATWADDAKERFATGVRGIQRDAAKRFRGAKTFASLTADQQDKLLRGIEKGPFFGTLRFASICGLLALPKYGGNKDWIGWEIVGQERGFEYEPPFGYYDDPTNQKALLGRVL